VRCWESRSVISQYLLGISIRWEVNKHTVRHFDPVLSIFLQFCLVLADGWRIEYPSCPVFTSCFVCGFLQLPVHLSHWTASSSAEWSLDKPPSSFIMTPHPPLPVPSLRSRLPTPAILPSHCLHSAPWVYNVRHRLGLGHWSTSSMSLLRLCHLFLQAPQWPNCTVRKRFSRDHCCRGRSEPGCWEEHNLPVPICLCSHLTALWCFINFVLLLLLLLLYAQRQRRVQ